MARILYMNRALRAVPGLTDDPEPVKLRDIREGRSRPPCCAATAAAWGLGTHARGVSRFAR